MKFSKHGFTKLSSIFCSFYWPRFCSRLITCFSANWILSFKKRLCFLNFVENLKTFQSPFLEHIFNDELDEIKSVYLFEKWFSKVIKEAILSSEFSALLLNSPRLTRTFENGTQVSTILESESNFNEKQFGVENDIDLHWRSGNESFISGTSLES